MEKECTTCGLNRDISLFYLKRGKPRAQCKICHKNYYKKAYSNNRDKYNKRAAIWASRNRDKIKSARLKQYYKIDINIFNNMLLIQNNCCNICRNDFNLENQKSIHVDHCHKTYKIRGLLCVSCNQGLGYFKDNIQILENAIDYLKNNN